MSVSKISCWPKKIKASKNKIFITIELN